LASWLSEYLLIVSSSSAREIDSMAVLPFVNESSDRSSEYLSDGITEGLINSLSQLPDLSVMSRNSVFRLKGKEADAHEVGRDLGVDSVLLGRVRQEGEEIIINAELVDSRTRRQIWGEQFRRRMPDLVLLQEQIISSIAGRCECGCRRSSRRLLLSDQPKVQRPTMPTFVADITGTSVSPDALKQADEYFEKAAALDPEYALANSGLRCMSCVWCRLS
jgi:TolB-like protein